MELKMVPTNPADQRKFRRWVMSETKRLEEQESILSILLRDQMLSAWEQHHPQMMSELKKMGIPQQFADLMQARMWQTQEEYQRAGMHWPDSKEQAMMEWLMLEPED